MFIKNILLGLGYSVSRFDIDHFSALRATIRNSIEKGRTDYCIVGFRGDYFDIGIIKNASLSNYHAGFSTGNFDEDLKMLKLFLSDKIIEPCYFFGDRFNSEIVNDLAMHFGIKYYGILDSFHSVIVPPSLDIEKKIIHNRSDYVFSIGSIQ